MERTEVYKLIDGERTYQDTKWNSSTTTSHGNHSPEEWFTYITDYVREAQHILSRGTNQRVVPDSMAIMRKVAAMAVCAMEQIGAPAREVSEDKRSSRASVFDGPNPA